MVSFLLAHCSPGVSADILPDIGAIFAQCSPGVSADIVPDIGATVAQCLPGVSAESHISEEEHVQGDAFKYLTRFVH